MNSQVYQRALTLYRKGKKLLRVLLRKDIYYFVHIACAKEYVGSEYGGYFICPSGMNENSIIYSFGIGEDLSFDLAMIDKFRLHVHGFDPTPKAIDWIRSQNLPKQFHFHEFGIADYDGVARFSPPNDPRFVSFRMTAGEAAQQEVIESPVSRLQTIQERLGHQKIDILKMDIEGAEYQVIVDLIRSHLNVSQLLVEFHHRFKDLECDQTQRTMDLLENSGYRLFGAADQNDTCSFIKINEEQ